MHSINLISCLLIVATTFFTSLMATPPWPNPYWDIPGDYCRATYPRGRCCPGRKDPCSVPILGTLCYCDTFCNRTGNSDCCPDYFTHCEGLEEEYQYAQHRPEEVVRPEELECNGGTIIQDERDPKCFYKGQFYNVRDVIQDNCNTCNCQVSSHNSRCMEVRCESNPCLFDAKTSEELQTGFESGQYTWRSSKNQSIFWGRTLSEGLSKRLGTKRPDHPTSDMSAMKFHYKESDLPSSFDARQKWPGKVHGATDQGWCGASWAFSTTSVATDRFAIEDQSDEDMSPQALISCNTQGQFGCGGGSVDRAWNYLRKYGTVPEDCYPFEHIDGVKPDEKGPSSCRLPHSKEFNVVRSIGDCQPVLRRKSMFRTQPPYRVGRRNSKNWPRRTEMDIMYEVMTHGPVQALMEVFSDLFLYESGVYQKTNLAVVGQSGFHSVKIIGWGEENGVPYWLCVNSWGPLWGQNGLFKILRGQNECHIEDFVVGVWVQTEQQLKEMRAERRRRRLEISNNFKEKKLKKMSENEEEEQHVKVG